MKVNDISQNQQNFMNVLDIIFFVQFQCTLLTFTFTSSGFKSWPRNFSFIQTDIKFKKNLDLGMVKVKKVNIALPTMQYMMLPVAIIWKS
jgi:flagellar biosynthesis protein FliR